MKTQIVTQRILTAAKGKYITDGETIAQTVVLPESADASVWREITATEKAEMERAAATDGI